jgi:hypothetical protein
MQNKKKKPNLRKDLEIGRFAATGKRQQALTKMPAFDFTGFFGAGARFSQSRTKSRGIFLNRQNSGETPLNSREIDHCSLISLAFFVAKFPHGNAALFATKGPYRDTLAGVFCGWRLPGSAALRAWAVRS